jgi:hypothetical protein
MNKVFFIILIIVFIFKTETVFSYNDVYDVDNIKISGKLSSNSEKEKLIDSAFKKAFVIFIKKVLLSRDVIKISDTKLIDIKELIFSYQISKNEINNKENILTVNIRFDQKKINKFLASREISYADVSNISLTLLPVFIKNKETLMYSDNFFYTNWVNEESDEETFIKYNLALENIEDLELINKNKDNLDLVDLKKLSLGSESKNNALIIVYFVDNKFRAYIKTFIGSKVINKNIDLNVSNEKNKNNYEKIIKEIKKELEEIWKSQNLIDINTPSFLNIILKINENNDYLEIKKILDKIDTIENYQVLELTKNYAKLRIKYNGKISKMKNKLIEKNIIVSIIDSEWNLKIK